MDSPKILRWIRSQFVCLWKALCKSRTRENPLPVRAQRAAPLQVGQLEKRIVLDASGVLNAMGELVITGDAASEALTISEDTSGLAITDESGSSISITDGIGGPADLTNVSSIHVNLGEGNDLLRVEPGALSLDITFDGGLGSDGLSVAGSVLQTQSATYTADVSGASPGAGSVFVTDAMSSTSISFSNLEPVDISSMASVTVQTTGANDELTISNDVAFFEPVATDAIRVSGTSDGIAIETAAVWNIGSLSIDTVTGGSDGSDSIDVASVGASRGIHDLSITTGSSGDSLTYSGSLTITGSHTVSTDAVIADEGGSSLDIAASSLVVTASGFGTVTDGSIETDVDSVTIDTSTAGGDQFVTDFDTFANVQLNAGSGDIALSVSGAINDADSAIDITADQISIEAASIGSAANPFELSAASLATDTSATNGDQFLAEADSLDALTLNAGTGLVSVASGEFSVLGTATAGQFEVLAEATLSGTGNVSAAVDLAEEATLSPGLSPGILTTSSLALSNRSNFDIEINGPAAGMGGHDQVVAGSVDLGEASLNVTLGYTPATNDSFIIVNNTGASAVTGTFQGLAEGDTITVSDVTLQITYVGGDGNDVELRQVPIYDFSAATFSVSEDAASGTATVTVVRSGSTLGESSVDIEVIGATTDGATDGSDFTAGTFTVDFADGESSQDVQIAITNDAVVELNEAIDLSFVTPTTGQVGSTAPAATLTIVNDDSASIAVTGTTDEASGTLTLIATLTGEVDTGVTVDFSTGAGTADAGNDYVFTTGSFVFDGNDGEIETATITVIDEAIVESDETIEIVIDAVSASGRETAGTGEITASDGEATINNDDETTITIVETAPPSQEGDAGSSSTHNYDVLLSNPVQGGLTLDFATIDGSAIAGEDYFANDGDLTFVGLASEVQNISVDVIGDDTVELDESFTVMLGSVSGLAQGVDSGAVNVTVSDASSTIVNDESATISIDDVSLNEGDGPGTTSFNFTVTLDKAVDSEISFDFSTIEGSATDEGNDGDFVALPTETRMFASTAAGSTETISVTVNGDTFFEGGANEQFLVELANLVAGGRSVQLENGGATEQATGTILNDDTPTLVQIDASGNLRISDEVRLGADDQITISLDANEIVVTQSNGLSLLGSGSGTTTTVVRVLKADVTGQIIVDTNLGSDVLTIDYTGGDPLPVAGLVFNGGGGASDGLAVIGDGNVAVYTPDVMTAGSGVVRVDGTEITFVGLEPVDISGMLSATVVLPGADDLITIADSTDFFAGGVNDALRVSGTTGAVPIETAALWNNGSVVINTTSVAGDDTVTISGASSAHLNGNLSIVTGAENDSVNINGDISIGGDLSIQSADISINTASVLTGGEQSYVGAVVLGADTTLDGVGANEAIQFSSTVDGATNDLTIDGGGSFAGAVSNVSAFVADSIDTESSLAAASVNVTGTSDLGGDVTSTGNASFGADVALTSDVTIDAAMIAVTGNVSGPRSLVLLGMSDVSGTVGTDIQNLTVQSGQLIAGTIDITGNLDADENVSTDTGGILVDGNVDTEGTLSSAAGIDIGGTSDLGDNVTSVSNATFGGDVTLTSNVMIDAAMIAVTGNVSGPQSLVLQGTSDVSGTVGTDIQHLTVQTGPLTAGTIDITGDLDADENVSTDTGGILVDGNIDTEGTLSSAAGIDIGGTSDLGGNVTSAVDQHYAGGVTITANLTFNGAAISFDQTIDGNAGTDSNVILAATGDISVTGAVGGATALDSLSITTANDVTLGSTLQVAGDLTQTGGSGTTTLSGTSGAGIGGAVSITTNEVVLQSGDITSVGAVTLNAQNAITLGAMAGINAGASQILIEVNQDGTGSEGFSQDATSTIQTTHDGPQSIAVDVAGAGNVSIGVMSAGTTAGEVLVRSAGGAITDSGANAATNITAFATALRAATGIGSSTDAVETQVSRIAFDNSASGNIAVTNAGALTVASVDGLATSANAGGGVTLVSDASITFAVTTSALGNIVVQTLDSLTLDSENIEVNAAASVTSTDGDVTLEAGDRITVADGASVQSLAASGQVTLASGEGDVDNDGRITLDGFVSAGPAGDVTLDLNATDGATQSATGSIVGAVLHLFSASASGSFDLDQSIANDVAAITADSDGSIAFRNSTALTVGTLTSGISTTNDDVTLCAESLTLMSSVALGTGTVRLQATAGSVNQLAGSITADSLGVSAATGIALSQTTNDVDTFAAVTTSGDITYLDANTFGVASVSASDCFTLAVTGVTTPGAGNITLEAVSEIMFIVEDVTSGGGNIDLDAGEAVVAFPPAFGDLDIATTDSGGITIDAGNSVQLQGIDSTQTVNVTTVDGDISIGGGAGMLMAPAPNIAGVDAANAVIQTASGSIHLTGMGGDDVGGNNDGLTFDGSTVSSTSGSITLEGTGGAGGNSEGVEIEDSTVTTAGDIEITGVGGADAGIAGLNSGVDLDNSAAVIGSGAGTVTIEGTGGAAGNENYGVQIQQGSLLRAADGALSVTGTGGDQGDFNAGLLIVDGALVDSTGDATVTLDGTGGALGPQTDGVFVAGSTIQSTTGDILVTGVGGAGADDLATGVTLFSDAVIQSLGSAAVTVHGTGGGGAAVVANGNNFGVAIETNTSAITSVDGNISITGIGGGVGTSAGNVGVLVDSGTVSASGLADILIDGTGGAGPQSDGVRVENTDAQISSISGSITITGQSSAEDGIEISSTALVSSDSGVIGLSGTGLNHGVVIESDGSVTSTGPGVVGGITVTGESSGTGDGVRLGSTAPSSIGSITAVDADITILGTAATGDAISLLSTSSIAGLGLASITLDATGSIFMEDGSLIDAAMASDVNLTATGNITISQVSSVGGQVEITSTAGAIIDGGDSDTDITAASAALIASLGVGSGGANTTLETAVSTLVFENSVSGDVLISNSLALTIADVGSLAGSSNSGGDAKLTVAGDLDIDANLNTGSGNLLLNVMGNVTQQAGDNITAAGLGLMVSGTTVLNNAGNNVAVLAIHSGGSTSYQDVDGIAIGSVMVDGMTIVGVTLSNTDLTLCATTISLTSAVMLDTGTLRLAASGGSVSQTAAGSITAQNLGVRATGDVSLNIANNDVSTFAATSPGGNISFADSNGFSVGVVGDDTCFSEVIGVTTDAGSGDINLLATAGMLNIDAVVTSNTGNIDVDSDVGTVDVNAVISSTSGDIDVIGNEITQDANIQTSSTGTIAVTADNGDVTMADGTTTSSDSGTIVYDATGNVVLSTLSSATGDQSVTATTGSISDGLTGESANLATGGTASLSAATGIGGSGLADLDTSIDVLEATNSDSGDIVIEEADGLTIAGTGVRTLAGNGNVDVNVTLNDLSVASDTAAHGSGNVLLTTDDGSLSAGASVSSTSGNVLLMAGGAGQDVDVEAMASVTSAGRVTLMSADSVTLGDTSAIQTSGTGTVNIEAAAGDVTMHMDASLQSVSGDIRVSAAGQIVVGDIISSMADVSLTAGSLILDADATGDNEINVTAIGLRLHATNGIGLLDGNAISGDANAIETDVSSVSARGGSNGINILEADDITVSDVSATVEKVGVDGSTASITDMAQSDLITSSGGSIVLQTLDGSITLEDGAALTIGGDDGVSVGADGGGKVLLFAGGMGSDVITNADVVSASGDITVEAAAGVDLNEDVRTSGTILISALSGDVTIDDGGADGFGIQSTGASDVLIEASADIVINADVASAGGAVGVVAGDDVLINANLSTAGGDALITAANSVTGADPTDGVVMANGTMIATSDGDVLVSASGGSDIRVALIDAGAGQVSLDAADDIIDSDDSAAMNNVTASSLRMVAGGLIGASAPANNKAIDTTVAVLAASSGEGIFIRESDAVIVDTVAELTVTAAAQRVAGDGTMSIDSTTSTLAALSDLTTIDGPVKLVATDISLVDGIDADGQAVNAGGSGDVLLDATGADISASSDVLSGTGNITLVAADNIEVSDDVRTGGVGDILMMTTTGGITVSNSGVETTGGGNILLDSATTITLDAAVASGSGNIGLISTGATQQNANVTTGGGDVLVDASSFTMSASALTSATAATDGNILVQTTLGDISLGRLDAGSGSVSLGSAGAIIDSGASSNVNVVAGDLQIVAVGLIGDDDDTNGMPMVNDNAINTSVDRLAASSAAGIYIQETDGIVVDSLGDLTVAFDVTRVNFNSTASMASPAETLAGIEDLTTTSGPVKLVAVNGNITVDPGTAATSGISAAGDLLLETRSIAGDIIVNADAVSGGHASIVSADDIVFGVAVDAGNTLFVSAENGTAEVASDGVTMLAGSSLTAGDDVAIHVANLGDFEIQTITAAGANVSLDVGGNITDGNGALVNISASGLSMLAGGAIGDADGAVGGSTNVNAIDTQIETLAARSANGIYVLESLDDLTIDTVSSSVVQVNFNSTADPVTAALSDLVTTSAGPIKVVNSSGDITVNSGSLSIDTDNVGVSAASDGNVLIDARAAGSTLQINSDVSSVSGHVTLLGAADINIGDSTSLAAEVISSGGLGSMVIEAGTGAITMDSDSVVQTSNGNIHLQAATDVVVGRIEAVSTSATPAATDSHVSIAAISGSILDADAAGDSVVDITAEGLRLFAGTGIGALGAGNNAIETTVTTVSARSASGGINIVESDAINVDEVTVTTTQVTFDSGEAAVLDAAQSDLQTISGNGSIVLRTLAGDITLSEGNPAVGTGEVLAHGSGNVLISAEGTNTSVAAEANIHSETGNITVEAAEDVSFTAGVSVVTSDSGTIDVDAGAGSLLMSETASLQTASGDIRIRVGDDTNDLARIGDIIAETANVSITSAGSILDADSAGDSAGDSDVDVTSVGLRLVAGIGVGTLGAGANAIETTVERVSARATEGGVNLTDSDNVTVGDVEATVNRVAFNAIASAETDDSQSDLITHGASGNIVLQTVDGTITLSDGLAGSMGGADGRAVVAAGDGNVLLMAGGMGQGIDADADILSGMGHITLMAADTIDLGVNVDVQTADDGTIDLVAVNGAILMDPSATLQTVDGDIRAAASDSVVVGDITASAANVSLISLAGSILDADPDDVDNDVTAIGLRLDAAVGAGTLGAGTSNAIETDVDTISARAADGGINLIEVDDIVVGDVDAMVNRIAANAAPSPIVDLAQSDLITTNDGSIVLRSVGGAIILSDGSASADGTAIVAGGIGNVLVQTESTGSDVVIDANIDGGSGNISIVSVDDILQNADVATSDSGTITMDSGNAMDDSVGNDGIVMASGTSTTTGGGNVRFVAGAESDILLGLIDVADGDVSLIAERNVLDNGGTLLNVSADALRIVADSDGDLAGTIGTPDGLPADTNDNAIQTSVNTLAAWSADGIYILESDEIAIDSTTDIDVELVDAESVTATVTDVSLSDLETTEAGPIKVATLAGTITIREGDADDRGVTAGGDGDVLLESRGIAADVVVEADVESQTGHVSIVAADDIVINADVSTGSPGTIVMSASNNAVEGIGADGIQMLAGSSITSGSDISLSAGGESDIVLQSIDAGSASVHLAAERDILDGNAGAVNVRASSLLLIADSDGDEAGTIGNPDGASAASSNLEAIDIQVDSVAARSADGIYLLESDGNLEITTVTYNVSLANLNSSQTVISDTLSNLQTTDAGSIKVVTTDGDIIVADSTIAGAEGDILIDARGSGSVTLAGNVQSGTGHITIQAQESILQNMIEVSTEGFGTIVIDAGLSVGSTGGYVMSAESRLSTVSGDIHVQADQDVEVGRISTNANVSLTSTVGSIVDTDLDDGSIDIAADGLRLNAAIGVGTLGAGANGLETAVTTVSARAANGGINLIEADNVIVGDVIVEATKAEFNSTTSDVIDNTQSDLRTSDGGSIVLRTLDGNITLTEGTANMGDGAIDADGDGNVLIAAEGAATDILALADITSTTGDISILAQQNVTFGAGVSVATGEDGTIDAEATSGTLGMDASAVFETLRGDIRSVAGMDLTVGDITTDAGNVSLTSTGASILDADPADLDIDVTAIGLRLDAAVGIATTGNALETNVDRISGRATSGGINLLESDDILVDDVDATINRVGPDAISTGVTDVTQSDLRTTIGSGDIVLRTQAGSIVLNEGSAMAGDGAISADGAGNVMIAALGVGTDITANADIESATGSIALEAARSVLLNANIDVTTGGSGTIDLTATAGSLTMVPSATINSANGNITGMAELDVTIGDITSTGANVILTSVTSQIIDADPVATDNEDIVAVEAILSAPLGIGDGNAIETSVEILDATVATRGAIDIAERDSIELRDVLTGDGPIDVVAGGTITATSIESANTSDLDAPLADPASRDISLVAQGTGSSILVTQITASGGADVHLTADDDILDTDASDTNLIAADDLELLALNSSGSGNAIQLTTSINDLHAEVTGTARGDLEINETNTLNLATTDAVSDASVLRTSNGEIRVTAGDSITVADPDTSNEGPNRTGDLEIDAGGDNGRIAITSGNDITIDEGVQIRADQSTPDAVVITAADAVFFGTEIEINTGNSIGVARTFGPRPDMGVSDSAFYDFDTVSTTILASEPGGFGGDLFVEIGTFGERGLAIDIDWGAENGRFQQELGFDGDAVYTFHHVYSEAELLTSTLNGRASSTAPVEVRFAIRHHDSIIVNGASVEQGVSGVEPVPAALLSSTDATTLQDIELTNGEAQFTVPNLSVPTRLFFPPPEYPEFVKRVSTPAPVETIALTSTSSTAESTSVTTSSSRDEYFQIRAVSPDPRVDSLAPPERLPDDILSGDKLQKLFSKLPDGTYEIEYVLGEGNERSILRVEIRQGKPIIPGEGLDGGRLRLLELDPEIDADAQDDQQQSQDSESASVTPINGTQAEDVPLLADPETIDREMPNESKDIGYRLTGSALSQGQEDRIADADRNAKGTEHAASAVALFALRKRANKRPEHGGFSKVGRLIRQWSENR